MCTRIPSRAVQQHALAAQRGGRARTSRCALTRAHGLSTVTSGRRAGRSPAGPRASSARSMPYLAISSAALAVSACASGGVTPSSSALASSLRTRSSRSARCLGVNWRLPRRVRAIELPGIDTVAGRTLTVPRALDSAGDMTVQIAPSILAADFARLADEAAAVAECRRLAPRRRHGRPLRAQPHPRPAGRRGAAQARQPAAGLPPDDRGPGPLGARLRRGRRAERDHPRRGRRSRRCARCGRSARPGPGPAWRINPATPVEPYADLLAEVDMLLLMTVEPGFGGQHFLDLVLPKIRRARRAGRAATAARCGCRWTAGSARRRSSRCAEAGADVFVAGSAVYEAPRTRPPRSSSLRARPSGPLAADRPDQERSAGSGFSDLKMLSIPAPGRSSD